MNILEQSQKIIYSDDPNRDRLYGPFSENMEKCAIIASVMCGKQLTAEDCFNVMIAQKLVRESYHHKEDNLLDAVGYIAGLNNYKNDKANTTAIQPSGDQSTDGKNPAT